MAIGLAKMFNITLPENFDSPYQANNIIDFWRRWHITLSRFLRNYLYIPLGGNKRGRFRRHLNLMITMLVGGLWHGAGWNFVIWGGLHGCYLVANHFWRGITQSPIPKQNYIGKITGRILTLLAVIIAWVYFRADTTRTAKLILGSMFGNGSTGALQSDTSAIWWITLLFLVTQAMPNTYRFLDDPSLKKWSWKPTPAWSYAMGLIAALALLSLSQVSEFLYFRF